ncbi:hypothetical protein [uncultured Sphingomonas sp.]|uniref:hypothetical protein n=1 Tax=uncultured Sphingomonas sp. TaxID=158754 RepID=UPI0035CA4685
MAEPVHRRLAIPGQDPADDRLLGMVAALASEIAVLRERLDTVERLAGLDAAAIDGFVPDAGAQAGRDALRRRLIDKIFGPLRDALGRSAGGTP